MFMRILPLLLFILAIRTNYQAPPYADWAHSHVVWINKYLQQDTELYEMVKNYQKYGIPVGGVNIDSTWSECINNFIFDKKKFPQPQSIVPYFHSQGIKVILWTTSIINIQCPQYQDGKSKGYFLNNGQTIKWSHGEGALVDFFNPNAKRWFQGLMDRVFNLGFDGWKCDGTDPMIYKLRPMPYSAHLKRYVGHHEYANKYYGTFYNYTKSKNPNTLIMSRPVDSYKSKLFLSFAPKYVMFSGWVGDQENTPAGFRAAMVNIIHSASRGFLNFGFDIGGYRQRKPTQKWLFLRWVQTGALLPFMENGGIGKHQPWLYDNQTIDIYRKFVLLHYNFKDFFLTAATQAYGQNKSVLQPLVSDRRSIQLQNPENLGYVIWNTFLVEPIFQQNGYAQIIFPKGYKWIYFFNHSIIFQGRGQKQSLAFNLDQTPLFLRSNSIIPLKQQIWFVYLQEGIYSTQIIGGQYSDQVYIRYDAGQMTIKLQRFYKSYEVQQRRGNQSTIKVRIIGVNYEIYKRSNANKLSSTQTEYENEFYVEIQLSKQNHLHLGGQAYIMTE